MKPYRQSFSNQHLRLTHQLSLPHLNCDPFEKLATIKNAAYLKPICHRRIISEDVLSRLPKSLQAQNPELKNLVSPKSLQSPRLSPSSFLKLNPTCKISKLKVPCKKINSKIQDKWDGKVKVCAEKRIFKQSGVLDLFKSSFKGNYLVKRTDCSDSSFSEFSFGN